MRSAYNCLSWGVGGRGLKKGTASDRLSRLQQPGDSMAESPVSLLGGFRFKNGSIAQLSKRIHTVVPP